jgi:flagellar M-ring protein FliF
VDALRQAWTGIKGRLTALSVNQRLVLGMVAAAVLISAATFGLWLGREEQAVLFADLSPEDANAALQELDKRDVAADLSNGGTTILVPAAEVHRLRVELASRGIGSSGVVGFEIFDESHYGMTEQDYEVKRQRALQGELTKTIESLRGVDAARVHLVMPKTSIFRSLSSEPTASVVLTLNRRLPLSGEQVAGIQSLVAASVENLPAANVTVLDQNGRALSEHYADEGVGASDRQLELKKEVEQYLSDKAQTMLSSVLGQGRSHVRVDARLNFEKIESERTIFDPDAQVIRSEERNESTDPTTGGGTSSTMTNYEINQTVEHIVGETGGVEQLSVAVSVDGNYSTPAEGGEPVYEPLPQEELKNIERMVESAIGIDRERGDRIEVVNLQFRGDPAAEEPGGVGGVPLRWLDLLSRYGGRALLVILLAGLVIAFRRNLAAALGDLSRADAGGGTARGATAAGSEASDEEEAERFSGMPELTDQMIEDVREYAAENPERVAEVVQSWLYEPERAGGR